MYHFFNLECNLKTWPDVDNGVICGDCYALIKIKSYDTCRRYCDSLGLKCFKAFEESGDSCTIKRKEDCDTVFYWTSDALCQCTSDTVSRGNTSFIIRPP